MSVSEPFKLTFQPASSPFLSINIIIYFFLQEGLLRTNKLLKKKGLKLDENFTAPKCNHFGSHGGIKNLATKLAAKVANFAACVWQSFAKLY